MHRCFTASGEYFDASLANVFFFLKKGVMTPEESVLAGGPTGVQCPTWSWYTPMNILVTL
jgi:hypothetical protein